MNDMPRGKASRPATDLDRGVLGQRQRLDARSQQDRIPATATGAQHRLGIRHGRRRHQDLQPASLSLVQQLTKLRMTVEEVDQR